jgi:hypothetical protein
LEEHDRQTIDLSLLLRLTPDEAERLPFVDSTMLLERHYEQMHAQFRNEAALHGMTLQ